MHYDLLQIPDGYETEMALAIAPYFDPKFVKKLVDRLAPSRIRLIIDDGIRQEDVDKINRACGKQADTKIRLAGAKGLVHMKAFYFVFVKTEGRRQRKRRFLFGSANATEAAFGHKRNAELMAEVDLSAGQDGDVLAYLDQVIAAIEGDLDRVDGEAYGPLRNPPRLYLPSFNVKNPGQSASGFDVWLQRGVLAAKYRDAQQFLIANVRLENKLPQDLIAEMFSKHGLIEQGERDVVRFAYMMGDAVGTLPKVEATPQWKARYCIWTHLGDWVSDDCYRALGDKMNSKSAPLREAKIKELLEHGEDQTWKDKRKEAFLAALDAVWHGLIFAKVSPADYLKGRPPTGDSGGSAGRINESYYSEKFDMKLAKDILLAQDEEFFSRYVNGYEFPDVPRFRQDTAAWERFALSWCESIVVESAKGSNSKNLLVKRMRETMLATKKGAVLEDLGRKDILKWLRRNWEEPATENEEGEAVGEVIAAYF